MAETATLFTLHADRAPVTNPRRHGPPPRGVVLLSRARDERYYRGHRQEELLKRRIQTVSNIQAILQNQAEEAPKLAWSDRQLADEYRDQLRRMVAAREDMVREARASLVQIGRDLAELERKGKCHG
jgi:hypothetical protein